MSDTLKQIIGIYFIVDILYIMLWMRRNDIFEDMLEEEKKEDGYKLQLFMDGPKWHRFVLYVAVFVTSVIIFPLVLFEDIKKKLKKIGKKNRKGNDEHEK